MGYESINSHVFLEPVERWIAESGEVLALIRLPDAAGNKEFPFFASVPAFREQLALLPPLTCITVFRQQQLPVRGIIDDDFIAAAMASVPDGQEFLIASLDRIPCGPT